jgi:tetratricopeptide (TPR) repeat protein
VANWRAHLVTVTALLASLACGAQQPTPDDLNDVIVSRDSYRDSGDLAAAQAAALDVVSRVEAEHGAKAQQLVEPLLALARINRDLGNATEAESNFRRVIAISRSQQGKNSPDLIVPYQELARTFMDAQRFGDALTTLEQARSISRRNFGLFNMGQTQLFDDMTRAYLGRNDTAKAQQMQEEKITLAVRNFGAEDARVAPYREELADYYQRSRLKVAAREEFRKALRIYSELTPPDTPGELRTLREILRLNFVLLGDEDEHVRIAQLLTDNRISPLERARTLAVLGDFYAVRVADQNQAQRYWADAFRVGETLAPEEAAELEFSKPRMLDFVPPLNQVDQRTSRRKRFAWGTLTAQFGVSADGRAVDVQINMDPPVPRLAERYQDRLAATRFRPRIAGGEPVATARVRLTHAYRYFVD